MVMIMISNSNSNKNNQEMTATKSIRHPPPPPAPSLFPRRPACISESPAGSRPGRPPSGWYWAGTRHARARRTAQAAQPGDGLRPA